MTTTINLTITTPAGVGVIMNTILVVNTILEDIEDEEVTTVTGEGEATTVEAEVEIVIMSLGVVTIKKKGSQII